MTTTYTTNVNRETTRVKIEAKLHADESVELVWVERFERGELTGCGPSLAGLGGDLLLEVQGRMASLFDGTMLWSRKAAA